MPERIAPGVHSCSAFCFYHNRRTTSACRRSTLRSRRWRRVCRRRGWRGWSWRLRSGEKRIVTEWESLRTVRVCWLYNIYRFKHNNTQMTGQTQPPFHRFIWTSLLQSEWVKNETTSSTDLVTLWAFLVCSVLQVQLCETRRELQELKASLRVTQKEKEQLLAEKQVRQTGLCTPEPYLDKRGLSLCQCWVLKTVLLALFSSKQWNYSITVYYFNTQYKEVEIVCDCARWWESSYFLSR